METSQNTTTTGNESLLSTIRSLPGTVWILFVGVFLNKFGTFVVPFLTLYMTRRGFSASDAGLALGAYGIGRIGAALIGGHLADTLGRRKTIVLSMVLAAITMLLLSQAETLTAIILLTGLASLTGELYVPASVALLADCVPAHQRVTAYAAYRMAFNAGWAFGPATAAFLASHSYTWLFVGDAISSLLFAIVAWFLLPHGVRAVAREAGWGEAIHVLKRDRRLHQVLVCTLLIGLVVHQMVSTFGLQVAALGFSDATYGALLSLNGVLIVLFELALTTRSRRLLPRRAMAVGYSLMGLGAALIAVSYGVPALALAMVVFTVGEMIFAPVASAYVSSLAPAGMRGRYIGTWAFANSLSLAVAPSLGLMIYEYSHAALWVCCGGAGLLAALVMSPAAELRPLLTAVPFKWLAAATNWRKP